MLATVTPQLRNDKTELDMVVLLGQRYGDGLVYLRGGNDRLLLRQAIDLDLINEEGYLTPAGFTDSGSPSRASPGKEPDRVAVLILSSVFWGTGA